MQTEKENCRKIGEHGLKIIREISEKKNGEPLIFSPTAMQDGLPVSIMAQLQPRYILLTKKAFL